MMNYVKSEWYRMTRSREIYTATGIFCAVMLAINIVLALFNRFDPAFRYGTVRYSLNLLTGTLSMLFIAGGIFVWLLYAGERQNGILKNAVAYGIPRESIFAGKCLVTMAVCVLSMLAVLAVYIASACLLLDGPAAEPLRELLMGVASNLLSAFAMVILAVSLMQACEKQMSAFLLWLLVVDVIPTIFTYIGIKVEIARKIAMWMPWNFLRMEVVANTTVSRGLWDTPEGLAKCIVAGIAGIVIFTCAGAVMCRNKETQ